MGIFEKSNFKEAYPFLHKPIYWNRAIVLGAHKPLADSVSFQKASLHGLLALPSRLI